MAFLNILSKKNKKQNLNQEPDSKLYRAISLTSIIGIFLIVIVVVMSIFGYIKMNSILFGFLTSIGMLCLGIILCLPWIKRIEKNEFKKTSIVFVAFISVCTILWIISVWLGVNLYKKLIKLSSEETADEVSLLKSLMNTLNFIKVTLIITLQLMVASIVGTCVTRFRNTMLPFQAIAYASYGFLDFYLTFFLCCITINSKKAKFGINDSISLLGNKFMIMLLIISIIFMVIANIIINKSQERKAKEFINDSYNNMNLESKSEVEVSSVESRLESLKSMLEKNLITEEEYNKKKEDILKDM